MARAHWCGYTLLAMLAFAGNSVLCRLAFQETSIDAASFTFLRLASGTLTLAVLVGAPRAQWRLAGSWGSGGALFAYAAAFSFAYTVLPTGVGALLLFGAVQASMIGYGLLRGERLRGRQWIGVVLACLGVGILLAPGMAAPSLSGSLLMLGAGLAWGVYSLRGKGSVDPAADTYGNFVRACPMAVGLYAVMFFSTSPDVWGMVYACLSGAVASAMGYVVWYMALRQLTRATAAVVQLSVPAIAALGGVLLLGEVLSLRLVLATVATLLGIALVLLAKLPAESSPQSPVSPSQR